MNDIDVKAIQKQLAQALNQTFDDSKGIAVYGAGDTAERWQFAFITHLLTCIVLLCGSNQFVLIISLLFADIIVIFGIQYFIHTVDILFREEV